MNDINLEKINLYNFPKPLTQKDYEEVCRQIVADVKRQENIASVYLTGGQWLPGISDLDIIIVYDPSILVKNIIKLPWELSKEAKSIFIHRYENYNLNSFPWHAYISPR